MTPDTYFRKFKLNLTFDLLSSLGPYLVQIGFVRRSLAHLLENMVLSGLRGTRNDPSRFPGIEDDKTMMSLAVIETVQRGLRDNLMSQATVRTLINILKNGLADADSSNGVIAQFTRQYGLRPPSFMVLSPGKACNLHCDGCYADSGTTAEKLDWDIVDRMIWEAKSLWGARLFVFSGGEPFAYRSQGKDIVELIEKNPDCGFIMFTNGTLINEKISQRLAKIGNVLPAFSVEGGKERTDARRGDGVFDRVVQSMKTLRSVSVPFGLSLTGTCKNVEEILSDEFIDFFLEQGALYAWLFQYMPIGRSFTLDLLPTPEQRVWMWHRTWEIVRNRRIFWADFWNSGTVCDGCLSAGGHGAGGYFYVDWNGAVSPCVFLPYSPVNIKDVYARGGTLNDMWSDPFFESVRQWQIEYRKKNGNGLAPCPNRDHHSDLEKLIMQHEPSPIDENAAAALLDPGYSQGLAVYDEKYEAITRDIWENHYLHRAPAMNGAPEPLPDVTNIVRER